MLKRVSALFFIPLASIVIFANVIIPHHHHKSEVCIVISHCETDKESDKHNTDGHEHEHDGDNNTQHCVINQVFILPANQVKQEIKSLDFSDNIFSSDQFHANLINKNFNSLAPLILFNTQSSLLSSSYCHFVQNGLGMRAPPIV